MSIPTLLLINGKLVDAPEKIGVINPATGEVFASVPRATQEQAHMAIAAAKAAQPGWAATPIEKRREMLVAFADAIKESTQVLAETLVREQGKPFAEAMTDITTAETFVRFFAKEEAPVDVVQDDAALRVEVHHKPLGVVAGITPWNFPTLIAAYKLAPALIMGNTFILKPAPTTPVTSLMLGALAKNIFPAGVVNTLTDMNDLGPLLTSHPDIAKVSFTGSTLTGKRVMESAASTLKRVTLELGGNDAGIVLEDADVDAIAPKIFGSAFYNCGQVCIALKRIYVHSSKYSELSEALAQLAKTAQVGDGLSKATHIGPLQNATQYGKAKHFLEIARKDGKVIAGGDTRGPGYFMMPTIVNDISNDSELVQLEQFAPILPVLKYDHVDEAVRMANASNYGLGGSVWAKDAKRAYEVGQRMDTGTVWINHHLHFGPHIPLAGAKESGVGVEFSSAGLREYTQTSVMSIAKQ